MHFTTRAAATRLCPFVAESRVMCAFKHGKWKMQYSAALKCISCDNHPHRETKLAQIFHNNYLIRAICSQRTPTKCATQRACCVFRAIVVVRTIKKNDGH